MSIGKKISTWVTAIVIFMSGLAVNLSANAVESGEFKAVPGQINFMQPATPVMEDIIAFHDLLMWIITLVTIFVTLVLAYIMWRFREKKNPNPSSFTHHTGLEVVWTAVPIIILLVIAVPSFKLLYKEDVIPPSDMTIKAIGNAWYWTYEYPDVNLSDDPEDGSLTFDAMILNEADAKAAGHPRLLGTDNIVVVPVNKVVKVIVTSTDVIHAWAIPAFGVKIDAVPGRLNETWFKATKTGLFYGQCSELCGKGHGFMPINVKVVSQEEYDAWLIRAKKEYASNDASGVIQIASAN